LITAPNSDGQRDFKQELSGNAYGYHFIVTEFLTQLQGDGASAAMLGQLQDIYYRSPDFDAVAIVRGGGSQTDFKPFDNYDLARQIAHFPLPVFTGIGHDRNTSIADLMARQLKTPTKVAAALIDINFRFENEILQLAERLEDAVDGLLLDKQQQLNRWQEKLGLLVPQKIAVRRSRLDDWKQKLALDVARTLQLKKERLLKSGDALTQGSQRFLASRKERLDTTTRLLHQLSPQTVLNRGFAMVMHGEKVITDISQLKPRQKITTLLKNGSVASTINEVKQHEQAEF